MTDLTPPISEDPEIRAEEKKNRIWHLKLERYKEIANAVGVILQTFKAEAVSLVSGVGTLVIGWFQVRKYVLQGRSEVRALRSAAPVEARAGAQHRERPTTAQEPAPAKTSPFLEGVMGVPETGAVLERNNGFADPMNYFPIVTLVVFIGSSIAVWRKRKNKPVEGGQ